MKWSLEFGYGWVRWDELSNVGVGWVRWYELSNVGEGWIMWDEFQNVGVGCGELQNLWSWFMGKSGNMSFKILGKLGKANYRMLELGEFGKILLPSD